MTKNDEYSQMASSYKFSTIKTIKDQIKDSHLVKVMDKALKHLNQISEANTLIQDLYIELVKEKKIMKYDQIRKIYKILTEGKAKQILFEKEKQQIKTTDYQSHEGLIRICWRSIQKLVQKITYYMVNQSNLAIISKNVLKLIKLHQNFMRRFRQIKNSSILYIIDIIEHLLIQNSILEKKIYQILLNRGYVVSLDEFYKLNGIGADHTDNYYAKQDDEIQQAEQKSEKQSVKQQKQRRNSKNNFRKKKGFRIDCRYSWKTQQFQQNSLSQTFPLNKTNYQIRQSFQKFMGDIFQNENFTQILKKINLQNQQDKEDKQSETLHQLEDPSSKNKGSTSPILQDQKNLHKKIFQNKIESVLSRLKSNSMTLKPSAKLLSIIDNALNKAVSNKLSFMEKKTVQRKNSVRNNNLRRESGNVNFINSSSKKKDSIITDRKIVNQNFFRQLLRQNSNYQTFIQNQLGKQKQIFDKAFVQKVSLTQTNFSSSILDQHQNSLSKNKLRKRFENSKNRDLYRFKNTIMKNIDTSSQENLVNKQSKQDLTQKTQQSSKKMFQLKINNFKTNSKNITANSDGFTQIIRILKQQSELNQQKKILQALKYLVLAQNGHDQQKLKSTLKNLSYNSLKQNYYSNETIKKSNFFNSAQAVSKRIKTEFQEKFNIQELNKVQFDQYLKIKAFRQKMNIMTETQKIKFKMKSMRRKTQTQNSSNFQSKYQIYDRRRMKIIK